MILNYFYRNNNTNYIIDTKLFTIVWFKIEVFHLTVCDSLEQK